MTNGLFSLFSSLIANTPPYRKGLSSRKFLSLFLILFLAVGNAWGQNEVTLLNTNFTDWKEGAAAPENKGLSESNTYTLTNGIADVADFVGNGCKLNDAKNAPTAEGVEGYNANKFRLGSSGNFMKITPRAKFIKGGRVRILVSSEQTKVEKILGTVKIGSTDLGNLHGWTAKNICDWQEFDIPESIDDEIGEIIITRTDNTMFVWGIIILTNSSAPATKHSVTYILNGGGGTEPTQEDVAEGATFTLAAAPTAPAGQEFAGWSDGTNTYNAGDTYTMGAAPVTFTAQWQAETTKYDVTYSLNGGTGTAPTQLSVAEGTTITLAEAPTWEGYRFDGWLVKDENGNDVTITDGKFTMPAAKVAITAQWVKVWTVTFNTNGGSTIEPVVVDNNGTLTAPTAPKKDCYAFVEWQKGEEAYDFAATITSDITLNATWTPKYASSFDFGATTDLTKDNIMSKLSAVNMAVSVGTGGGYDDGATTGYLGYKFKNKGDKVSFLLQKGYRTIITFGFTQSGWTINGEDLGIALATKAYAEKTYTAASTDMLYTLVNKSEDGKTSVITKIIIEPIPATSDDATLKDIQVNGTTIAGFNSATDSYYVEMPYGTQKADLPPVTATANHAEATVIVQDAKDRPDDTRATIKVTAEDGTTIKHYYVYFTNAAKEGVTIIKATHTGATTADVTGYIGGSVDKNTQGGGKLGSNGHYFGIKLAEGTFLAGDVVTIYASTVSTKVQIFSDEGETMINEGVFNGNYYTYTLTEATEWIYLYRTETAGSAMNPTLGYIEVQRYMAPFIESFVIGEAEGTIDQANKTIAIEVSASADVTALEPTIVAWANGSATVTPTGAQDFTNPVVYSVASAYAEDGTTEYTVTVTKAVPSADATLATLTYNGTNITLEADQYNYEVELPKGTVDVPTVTYTTNNAGATVVKTDAAVLPGATTIIVTAEDGTTQQNYTINFTVSTSDIITIFDGSTMSNIATSPSGAISWEIVGSTMGAGDKNTSYNDVTYTRALSCGNSTATKHFKIVVADNNKAQFEIIGMSNSSSDTRHAWLTNSTDKGEFANAIAGLTSNGYNPAKFTTDWLEEGTYYLHSDNTVAILLIRVKAEPVPAKCEAPTISGLADVAVCDLSSALLDGTATITDGGTVTYKWYAEGDAETVLATTATYAPTTVGNYYVVATNSLADHRDNSTTSSVVVVRIKTAPVITTEVLDQHAEAGNNVTLSVVATDAESYQWYTCDDAAGTNPVDVVGATDASLEVTVTSGMSQYYKVIVSNTCGSAETVAKVEEWHEVTPANVTGSRTWDWTAESMGEIATASGSVEYLMANVSSQVPNTEAFRSDMLYITANYANRGTSNKFFQGWQIRFYTEVPGKVSLNCRAIHGTMSITINGTVIDDAKGSDMGTATTPFFVPAGWVTIVFDNQSSGYEGEAARVQKIVFNATPDYTRDVTVGSLGTICLPSNVPAGQAFGATFYELEGKEPQYGKIVFDEVTDELEAGKPYLFQAQSDVLYCFYGTTTVTDPINSGAMKGTFVNLTLTNLTNIYYFAQKALWSCVDLTSLSVPANRAYVKMDEMPDITESNPAPGVRRITLGVNGQQVATGVDQVQGDEVPTKMIINGQLYIIRGEKTYDAQGKLVK